MTDSIAFIFDMDGTMIDNMHYHEKAWQQVFQKLGKEIPVEQLKPTLYGKNEEVIRRHFGDRFTKQEIAAFAEAKESLYRKLYKPHLRLIDGLQIFLQQSFSQNISMAIATAAELPNVNFVVDATNTRHYFNAIVTAEQTSKGKPDPEIFLMAAEQLHISPANCIVFEDAPKGAEAAYRAGMKTVMLNTSYPDSMLGMLPNVMEVINNFKTLSPESIIRKFKMYS